MGAIKVWQFHEDKVLSTLSRRMIERKLFKIKVSKSEFSEKDKQAVRGKVVEKMGISLEETRYFVYNDILTNSAYNDVSQHINLLMKSGKTMEVSKASDNLNISALADPVEKHFLCYPVFNAGKVRQLSLLNGIK